jgi:hypothetical protein
MSDLWRVKRHDGHAGHLWRVAGEAHSREEAAELYDKECLRTKAGGVRLTREALVSECWPLGTAPDICDDDERAERTRRPCPGCGVAPVEGRDADKVCGECAGLLRLARGARGDAR